MSESLSYSLAAKRLRLPLGFTLALGYLRDDVRDLVATGGLLTFGDHDYEQMVTIEASDGEFTASKYVEVSNKLTYTI